MDNLPELRDIHLPEGVSAFPPAYGWWVILATVLGIVIIYELWRYWRKKSKKLYALRLLNNIAGGTIISAREMSEILRRICVFKYPEAASLFGAKWIDFLNRHSKKQITGRAANLLIDAPYIHPQTQSYSAEDAEALRQFSKEWIEENL